MFKIGKDSSNSNSNNNNQANVERTKDTKVLRKSCPGKKIEIENIFDYTVVCKSNHQNLVLNSNYLFITEIFKRRGLVQVILILLHGKNLIERKGFI